MKLQKAFDEFVLDSKTRLSSSTVCWYGQRLRRLLKFLGGETEVEQITTSNLRSFVVSLREQKIRWADHPYHPPSNSGLSPSTVHGYVRVIRRFFRWLMLEGLIETDPAKRVQMPSIPKEPPKAISQDDLSQLMQTAKPDPRDYAIICFLADTGCRVGGLAGLSLLDLKLDLGCAVVREKGRGGWKSRTVYINELTQEALARWLKVRSDVETEALFISKSTGARLTTGGVYRMLERLALKAGITGRFNPHSFRHGWARAALANGANLADVAQVLGHEDEAITIKYYGRWARSELQERHSKFSPLGEDNL